MRNNKESSKKNPISDDERHYTSLISLFKYVVTIIITLITLIGAAVSWITYKDGSEMRAVLDERRKEYKEELNQIKSDLKAKESELDRLMEIISINVNNEVLNLKRDAIKEIGYIKEQSISLAKREAQNKINQIMSENNYEEFVKTIAEERMIPKINEFVDKRLIHIKEESVRKAIMDLNSDDKIKIGSAITFLLDPELKLNDSQVNFIIELSNTIEKGYRASLVNILFVRKSNLIISFFRNELNGNDEYSKNVASQYFNIHKIENISK